jgi:ketosteroid isomerase-like protein
MLPPRPIRREQGEIMDTAGILQLEARRYAAMTGNDFATLEALLHDELIYTHSSGVVDSKASYIEALKSGNTRYLEVTQGDSHVRFLGDVALVTAGSHIEVVVRGQHKSLDLRSLCAWTATPDGWRFIAWQSCALPRATT